MIETTHRKCLYCGGLYAGGHRFCNNDCRFRQARKDFEAAVNAGVDLETLTSDGIASVKRNDSGGFDVTLTADIASFTVKVTFGENAVKPARVIVADPPWEHRDRLGKRGAAANYATLGADELDRFLDDRPGIKIADKAILFLWKLSSMPLDAYRVMQAWGFEEKSEIAWVKTLSDGRRLSFGMGRYVRNCHEVAIIATRGGRFPVASHSIRSVFEAPIGEHSEKPEAFFRLVEELAEGPYLELFARRRRLGWTCLGDELA